ncbi:uncharacterized protein LOC142240904 [Haematobia irritans]|uniref:uncharacterized protein LOC142240904 n=1 Tax=Haematobia irritans TaxID=7368 RepID=UPI003F501E86
MFKWLLFVNRAIGIIICGTSIYYTIIEFENFSFMSLFIWSILDYTLRLLDFFVDDCICEGISRTFDDFKLSLNDFNVTNRPLKKVNRKCEEFTLYLYTRKRTLKPLGPFDMGLRTWFAMIAALVTIIIYLVQTHYVL